MQTLCFEDVLVAPRKVSVSQGCSHKSLLQATVISLGSLWTAKVLRTEEKESEERESV